jgi:hypothetical protein
MHKNLALRPNGEHALSAYQIDSTQHYSGKAISLKGDD